MPPIRGHDGSWYDGQLVCLNGHQITAHASLHVKAEKFCPTCGAKVLATCPTCQTEIRGAYNVPGVVAVFRTAVPKHCFECGEPFPWQVAAIENLATVLREAGLDTSDIELARTALPDIVSATPRTEGAALAFKRVLLKLGKTSYDVAIKVVSEIASEAALKAMNLK